MTAHLLALVRCVRSCLTLALLRLAYAVQPTPRKPPPPPERLYSVMVGYDGSRFVARLPALGAAHLVLRDYRKQVRA